LSLIREDNDFSHVVITLKKNEGHYGYDLDGKRWFASLEALQKFYENEEHSTEIKTSLKKCILPKFAGMESYF